MNTYKIDSLSGSYHMTIEISGDMDEPVLDTVKRSILALGELGLIPEESAVTNVALSSEVVGFIKVRVDWDASNLRNRLKIA